METEFLRSMGLTNYEIRAYLTLLSGGTCDARKVYQSASIPFGKVYDTLYSLEKRGLVKVQTSRPKKFMAVDPGVAVKSLLDVREKESQSLFKQAAQIEEELKRLYRAKPERSMFWSVAMGEDEAFSLYSTVIKEARGEILLYLDIGNLGNMNKRSGNPDVPPVLKREIQLFSALMDKEVSMRNLFSGTSDQRSISRMLGMASGIPNLLHDIGAAKPARFEFRFTPIQADSFALIDGEKVLLDLKNPMDPGEHLAGIYIWDKNLGNGLRDNFEKMWKDATPLFLK